MATPFRYVCVWGRGRERRRRYLFTEADFMGQCGSINVWVKLVNVDVHVARADELVNDNTCIMVGTF
jgi:hypothetical protein